MRTIRTSRFINFTDDGKSIERVELDVDTIDELPDGELNGVILAHGSTAFIVNEGIMLKLNGSGEWRNVADGSAVNVTEGGEG